MNAVKLIWMQSIDLDGYLKELHSGNFTITWKYIDNQYRLILEYKGKAVFYIDTNEKLQSKALIAGVDVCKTKAEELCKQYDIQLTKLENK